MWPEVAQVCLILAMGVAAIHAMFLYGGAHTGNQGWMALARPGAYLQWVLIVMAFLILTYGFVEHDFSVRYIASNSGTEQPLMYRIAAVWGAHEGSLLLWILIQASWAALVAMFSRSLPAAFLARVLAVMSTLNLGVLGFMLFTSNPFARLDPAPLHTRELNPLLQDPGLAIHPPILYIGYVGFSVAFAFAFAALLSGRFETSWARWTRPWTTAAWLFLTLGITLGSWWAYYELGWGGWWFWDPVENASFMPWLIGTALIHSLVVSEKKGGFIAWSLLLAIAAFSMTLMGTFLVRSGILTSVHAFATDPARGLYILSFLFVMIGSALLLYALRIGAVRTRYQFGIFSKETALLLNTIFLSVIAFMVLLGTLFPLLFEALGLGKISVGAPYFDQMFVLLALPLALMVGVGAMTRWTQDQGQRFFSPTSGLGAICLLASILVSAFMAVKFSWSGFLGMSLALWVAAWTGYGVFCRMRQKQVARWRQPAGFWGMSLAHLGIAVFILGISQVSAYSVEKNLVMQPGDVYQMGGYSVRFDGMRLVQEANYLAQEGRFEVEDRNGSAFRMAPQKRFYQNERKAMTEAAIDTSLARDVYVALGEPLTQTMDGPWSVRIYYKSFVACIWVGGLIMALGGLVTLSDKRYRRVAA